MCVVGAFVVAFVAKIRDFGLEADKFLTRIAFVDFDGLAALKIIKDDDFSSNNLLDIICPRIVKGVSLLKEWVQNQ